MKRLYYASPNSRYSAKMYEAPVAWNRYPDARHQVASTTVQTFLFHDKNRLFSALIRIARREMTINEASASHHITINVLKDVYGKMFTEMSNAMMKLMDNRKPDVKLTGTEMDETGFAFDQVTEEDLTISENELGEQYAYVKSPITKFKKARLDSSRTPGERIYAAPRPRVQFRRPEEEDDYSPPPTLTPFNSNQPPIPVQVKEEQVDHLPNVLVLPKEEDAYLFPNEYVVPKEEEMDEYSDDFVQPKEENEMNFLEPMFKFEDDLLLGDKEIKTEPKDDFNWSQQNDHQLPCSSNDYYGEDRNYASTIKEEEEEQIADTPDEDDHKDLCQAIEMALESSKLSGTHAAVMRAALKESMIHDVKVPDIVQVYKFTDSTGICNLINKARVFLKGICRKNAKDLPALFASSSAYAKDFVPGEPLDPLDTGRIEKIRDVIDSLSKLCMYPKSRKEALKEAIFGVCVGELTLNAASNKHNLPSSTIQPYLVKVRQRLGSILPPSAATPNLWNEQIKKYRPSVDSHSSPSSTDGFDKKTFTMEQIDQTVADLVMNSHYDQTGKQAIFDAVVSVITNVKSAAEAAKQTGIPNSTIQHYIGRTRSALNIPSNEIIDFVPRRKEPPTVALMAKKDAAPREDIEKYTTQVLKVMPKTVRRDHVFRAVVAAVMGEKTIREAAEEEGLPASSVHPYVTRVRHMLCERCPPPKQVTNVKTVSNRGTRIDDDNMISINEDETVTIDGISVPKSVRLLTRLITLGRIDYSKARPFNGSKDELQLKLIDILVSFRFKGDCANLAKGIIHVYVDDKPISEACSLFRLSHTTLASYARTIKVFIDFSASPCSKEYQYEEYQTRNKEIMMDIQGGVEHGAMQFPLEASRLPTEIVPIKWTEALKNETASKGFLSEADRIKDIVWNGEGIDFITRRLKQCFHHKAWKFDENGQDNDDLLPTLFLPQVSPAMRMERLKCIIQYVVNDRNATRAKLYIRPLLIHHLCNGFSLNYLLSIYGERIPFNEELLNKYCNIIQTMYKKTGHIFLEFVTNLTKCGKMLEVRNEMERGQKELEKEDLRREMIDRFPFLSNERWVPKTMEKLREEELEKRKYECDFYMYYALKAATELRAIGYLMTDPFINEIVRVACFNLPHSVCPRETAGVWATQYMKHVFHRQRQGLSRGAF